VVLGSGHGTDNGLAVPPEVLGHAIQIVFIGCLVAVLPFILGGLLMATRLAATFDDTNPWIMPRPTPRPSSTGMGSTDTPPRPGPG
jgi:hypothetical protein